MVGFIALLLSLCFENHSLMASVLWILYAIFHIRQSALWTDCGTIWDIMHNRYRNAKNHRSSDSSGSSFMVLVLEFIEAQHATCLHSAKHPWFTLKTTSLTLNIWTIRSASHALEHFGWMLHYSASLSTYKKCVILSGKRRLEPLATSQRYDNYVHIHYTQKYV